MTQIAESSSDIRLVYSSCIGGAGNRRKVTEDIDKSWWNCSIFRWRLREQYATADDYVIDLKMLKNLLQRKQPLYHMSLEMNRLLTCYSTNRLLILVIKEKGSHWCTWKKKPWKIFISRIRTINSYLFKYKYAVPALMSVEQS